MFLPEEFYDDYGNVKKKTYLPEWLKRAVYYRDRGRCQHCNKDLSGEINILGDRELYNDHVIPLEQDGTNDSTNSQLLCGMCNYSKGGKLYVLNIIIKYIGDVLIFY